jgi:hypothetical protein
MTFTVPVELVVLGATGLFGFFTLSLHGMWVIAGRLSDIRVDIALLKVKAGIRNRVEESGDL